MNHATEKLDTRTVNFSLKVINCCKNQKPNPINKPIIEQLVRSATSVGANYAEANNAASKQDFKNKIYIAKKEAAETKYWLTLLKQINPSSECEELSQECQYILMTLQKIISTLNGKR